MPLDLARLREYQREWDRRRRPRRKRTLSQRERQRVAQREWERKNRPRRKRKKKSAMNNKEDRMPEPRTALAALGPEVSPARAWEPRPGRVIYADRDFGGWNNIVMALEVELGLARDGGFTLMLPRPQFWDHLGKTPREIFDYFDEATFRSVVPCMDYDPYMDLHQVTAKPATADGFIADKVQIIYRLFGRVEPRHYGWIHRALRFRTDILQKAERRLQQHQLTDYDALHVRRGDFRYAGGAKTIGTVPNDTIAKHVRDTVKGRDLLLLSDEHDTGLIESLQREAGAKRVVCWSGEKKKDEEGTEGLIDMLCAVPARDFVGTPTSTFSSGIVKLRQRAGTHTRVLFTIPYDEKDLPEWGRFL